MPAALRAGVDGVWQSLSSACALLPFAAAVAVPDPSSFATLAAASAVTTAGASIIFAASAPDVAAWLSLVCCKVCQRAHAAPPKVADASGFAALATSSQHGGPAAAAKQFEGDAEDDDFGYVEGTVKFTIGSEEEEDVEGDEERV